MNFEFDSWNRIQSMTYPDGEVVSYDYNRDDVSAGTQTPPTPHPLFSCSPARLFTVHCSLLTPLTPSPPKKKTPKPA